MKRQAWLYKGARHSTKRLQKKQVGDWLPVLFVGLIVSVRCIGFVVSILFYSSSNTEVDRPLLARCTSVVSSFLIMSVPATVVMEVPVSRTLPSVI